jgi:hypothetical protein
MPLPQAWGAETCIAHVARILDGASTRLLCADLGYVAAPNASKAARATAEAHLPRQALRSTGHRGVASQHECRSQREWRASPVCTAIRHEQKCPTRSVRLLRVLRVRGSGSGARRWRRTEPPVLPCVFPCETSTDAAGRHAPGSRERWCGEMNEVKQAMASTALPAARASGGSDDCSLGKRSRDLR